jgi:uncharacterized protein
MGTDWLMELFLAKKPVIAMAHIPALPGTPRYNDSEGVQALIDSVRPDVETLIAAGVDGLMFCNEDDRPHVLRAGPEQIAAMTRVVTECAPTTVPFGVDFLWDPVASVAIAHATGASFVREVFTGLYESDMGTWSPSAAEAMRFRRSIGATSIKVFFNVVPEFASALGTRTVAQRAKSAVVSSLADAVLVSGPMAGEQPALEVVREAKEAVPDVPVFLNTGARAENIVEFLDVADGVIVGSSLKKDGYTWNSVDAERANAFMGRVRAARQTAETVGA